MVIAVVGVGDSDRSGTGRVLDIKVGECGKHGGWHFASGDSLGAIP